jgi:hypothetical protein
VQEHKVDVSFVTFKLPDPTNGYLHSLHDMHFLGKVPSQLEVI